MTKFTDALHRDEVEGPLRRGFKLKNWEDCHRRLTEDDQDLSLFKAGLLIHSKANEIRTQLKVTFLKEINATTKLRSFVAVANYNFFILQDKTRDAIAKVLASADMVMAHDLAAIKIKLPIGTEFTPDEIIQTMVDGSQVPIKVVLEDAPNLGGNPQFSKVDWSHVNEDFNLGSFYMHLEDIWDMCLWSDYRVKEDLNGYTFIPNDPVWQGRLVVSRCRHDNLSMQIFDMLRAAQARAGDKKLHAAIGVRGVKAITKVGRKQVIKLETPSEPTDDDMRLMVARIYASEPYYSELLHEPQEKLGDASLNDLLNAWSVVSRVSAIMRTDLESYAIAVDGKHGAWLPRFAPVVQIDALVRAIVSAANLEYQQAKTIVEFLTFRGAKYQELWAQPLVPISIEGVAPMFAATTSPNLRRLVDVWLRQLEVDLGRRGPAFEAYISSELSQVIKSSPLLANAQVVENGFTFRPPNGREEQIDAVLVIGDLVIIGEAKCILHPSEAKQNAMHRKTVIGAIEQVKRKALSITNHAAAFRQRLHQSGITLPVEFRVVPVVILNGAIHAGFEVDGVPIVDMYIFEVFFKGHLVDLARRRADGEMEHLKKRILYSDATEASKIATSYFGTPPQLDVYLKGMRKRWVPIVGVSENDWGGQYLTFECIPELELNDTAIEQ